MRSAIGVTYILHLTGSDQGTKQSLPVVLRFSRELLLASPSALFNESGNTLVPAHLGDFVYFVLPSLQQAYTIFRTDTACRWLNCWLWLNAYLVERRNFRYRLSNHH